MKCIAILLILVLASAIASVDSTCPSDSSPVCYCSSENNNDNNPICDVTQPMGSTQNNKEECEAYCDSECGQGSGSSFSCENDAELPCTAGDTCKCGCLHKTTPPEGMQFMGQCKAFCDRADVCPGMEGIAGWSCNKYGPFTARRSETSGCSQRRAWVAVVIAATAFFSVVL